MAAAVPWIVMGGSALLSYMGSKKTKEEKAATGAQGQALQQQMQMAGMNFNAGFPRVQSALSYYDTLLRGNRAAQQQAVAAPMAQVTDLYRGAERNLERTGIRGGVRDMATAELGRDRANHMAQLTTGVQPMAAANLSQLGSSMVGAGTGAMGGAAAGFGNMAGQAFADRQYRNQMWNSTAGGIGEMAYSTMRQKQSQPKMAGG